MNQRLKCFISYSHADVAYMNDLEKFIKQLKREGVIETWTDRKLSPGDKVDPEISRNLEESDIVILLVSQDFIASSYCYEKEMTRAIERHEERECIIFPIVVRYCDWDSTPLAKYYLFSDALPLSKAKDKDEYLLRIARALRELCSTLSKQKAKASFTGNEAFERHVSKKFREMLLDTKVRFSNSYSDQMGLDEIFVWPDLKAITVSLGEAGVINGSRSILDKSKKGKHFAVIGDEQSGKTALTQMIAINLIKEGAKVVYLRGEQIVSAKNASYAEEFISENYLGSFSANKMCLVVDDFDKSGLNVKSKLEFLDKAFDIFDNVYITASTDVGALREVYGRFDDQYLGEVCQFTRKRRAELIHNWYSAGRVETITDQELEKCFDKADSHIEVILNKRLLSPKPIYVLMVLQTLDMSSPSIGDMSAYGHCYQKIIVQSLERAKVKANKIEAFINFISNFCYRLYKIGINDMSEEEAFVFFSEYKEKYLPPCEDPIAVLINCGLFRVRDERVGVSYKYVYYYCVGKCIAEDSVNRRSEIETLAARLHLESNAHILAFVTHHTKSQEVIDDIVLKVMSIFESSPEAELKDEDFENLEEVSREIPALVLEEREARVERQKYIEKSDEQERAQIGGEERVIDEANEFLRNANQSYRAVEVLGQIIKNRRGSFTKDQLAQLADEGVSVGLRYLKEYFRYTDSLRDEVIDLIKKSLAEKENVKADAVEKEARKFFWGACYMMAYSVVYKTAHLLGDDELVPIFDYLAEKKREKGEYSYSRRLCDLAIRMQHMKQIPKKEITSLSKDLVAVPITKRLLQELAINHVYMNTVDFKDKQWIAKELGIAVRTQNLISMQSGN